VQDLASIALVTVGVALHHNRAPHEPPGFAPTSPRAASSSALDDRQ